MRGKSLALLVVALGCGLVASIGITQVMSKRKAQDDLSSGETEAIFVALEDIALGEPLSAPMLRLEPWPKGKIPNEALTKIEDIEGRRARTKLYAGEPILDNKLFSKGDRLGGVSPMIPKGYRVVSVKVDLVSSSGSLIRPADRVDVLVHLRRNPGVGILATSTRTILQDVKVFAVNDVVELDTEKGGKSIAAKTISLLVVLEDAEKVILASQLGRIQLVMRSPDDDAYIVTNGTSAAELFGQSKPVGREDEDPMQKAAAGKDKDFLKFLTKASAQTEGQNPEANRPAAGSGPVPNRHRMRIIASEVKLVVLEPAGDPSASAKEGGIWRVSDLGEESVFNAPGGAGDAQEPDDQPEPEEEEEEEEEKEEADD